MTEQRLHFLQLNANKSLPITEGALQLAIERKIDVVLIQEPWIFTNDSYATFRSVNHFSFDTILPLSSGVRPRVLCYIAKSVSFQFTRSLTSFDSDPDIIAIVAIQNNQPAFQIINIYNQTSQIPPSSPSSSIEVSTFNRALQNHRLGPSALIAGDFNSHHPLWDPFNDPTHNAEPILNWLETNQLQLENDTSQITFHRPNLQRGSIIDLTLSKNLSVYDWSTTSETCSDHKGIYFSVSTFDDSLLAPVAKQLWNTKKANWELFVSTLQSYFGSSDIVEAPFSDLQFDNAAARLTDAIHRAANKSIPFMRPNSKAKPWWSTELTTLRKELARIQRRHNSHEVYQEKRNSYFAAIKKAKRDHWNAFLENESPSSIYKALRYTKKFASRQLPHIEGHSSFTDKATCLRQSLFPNPPSTDSPNWEGYECLSNKWKWSRLTDEELAAACSNIAVKGKTPGADKVTQELISYAYKAIPNIFYSFFSSLLEHGYHPTSWRLATGVILPKPNKPDYSVPKAYRVISLLPCLGKISERIIAKRLSWLAESTNLLHDSQIGGRQKKSAIDATLLLANEVELCKKAKRKTSTLFLDVKGAFDYVSKNRLLQALIDLGLPRSLIRWTESFLTNRALQLNFDNQVEASPSPINTGIPQGSPISPILFLIYVRELFVDDQAIMQISYIDDLSITTSSSSFGKNVQILQKALASLYKKATHLAIQFDSAKTELIHFGKSKGHDTSILLPTQERIIPSSEVKWLGITFDYNLSYKQHIATQASKAFSTFQRMSRLVNISLGLSAKSTKQLYLACILTVADYGSQLWYKGINQSQIKPLQLLQNVATRKILGVFKTAPILAMEAEAGLLPVSIRLQHHMRQYNLRTSKLQTNHPVNIAIQSTTSFTLENQIKDTQLLRIEKANPRALNYTNRFRYPFWIKRPLQNRQDRQRQEEHSQKLMELQSNIRARALIDWKTYPPTTKSTYFRLFGWKPSKSLIIPQGIKRSTASAFYQLKIRHGYIASYLAKLQLMDNDRCACGAKETVEHLILSCSIYTTQRKELYKKLNVRTLMLPLLFHTKKGAIALCGFLQETEIATRKWHLDRIERTEQADANLFGF